MKLTAWTTWKSDQNSNEKDVDVNLGDLDDDYEEAKLWLKRVILTSLFGSEKSAEYWMKNDPEVQKAIELMQESRDLLARRAEASKKYKKKKASWY